jgi:hypothetical protein
MKKSISRAFSAYVDLNPIRAVIADSLTYSDHTSIKRGWEQAAEADQPNNPLQQAEGLHPFAGNLRCDMPNGLPFRITDYQELVDWTGRILRDDKHGAIPESAPKNPPAIEHRPKALVLPE